MLLPSAQHRDEVIPSVQDDHYEMAENERQDCPHDQEMPQSRQMKSAHHPRQPRRLHRLPYRETGQHRKHAQSDCGSVSVFLQRVVSFFYWRLGAEEKVIAHPWPHSGQVSRREKNLLIVAAKNLISDVHQSGCQVNPHEGEMPLQRATQPAANGKRFRPIDQVSLWNLGSKAGKGTEDLKPAAYHHEQSHSIHPVAKTNHQWMLVHRLADFAGLRVLDRNRLPRHAPLPALLQPVKLRVTLIFPIPHSVEYVGHFQIS